MSSLRAPRSTSARLAAACLYKRSARAISSGLVPARSSSSFCRAASRLAPAAIVSRFGVVVILLRLHAVAYKSCGSRERCFRHFIVGVGSGEFGARGIDLLFARSVPGLFISHPGRFGLRPCRRNLFGPEPRQRLLEIGFGLRYCCNRIGMLRIKIVAIKPNQGLALFDLLALSIRTAAIRPPTFEPTCISSASIVPDSTSLSVGCAPAEVFPSGCRTKQE